MENVMHPVHKLPDGGSVINSDPPSSGPTIPVPGAEPVADGSHSEPYGLPAADLPEGKTAPPEGDTGEAENIVEAIRADQQKIANTEGEVILSLIAIGPKLAKLEALSESTYQQQLQKLGYSHRTAGKLRKIGREWGGIYEGYIEPDLFPLLPLDLDKLNWLCRLDAEQLRSNLSWIDPKRSSRKEVVRKVRSILGEKPPAARRVKAATALKTFDRLANRLVGWARYLNAIGRDDTSREGLTVAIARLRSALDSAVGYQAGGTARSQTS